MSTYTAGLYPYLLRTEIKVEFNFADACIFARAHRVDSVSYNRCRTRNEIAMDRLVDHSEA